MSFWRNPVERELRRLRRRAKRLQDETSPFHGDRDPFRRAWKRGQLKAVRERIAELEQEHVSMTRPPEQQAVSAEERREAREGLELIVQLHALKTPREKLARIARRTLARLDAPEQAASGSSGEGA